MANIAEPQVVINYISQLKKIIVNRNNQPSQLIIQTDYNLNEVINFQVINKINQIVQLDVNTTYQLYGTYIDAKKQVHILFYTLGVTPTNNVLSFLVNTYTSEYLAYVKNNRTPIDISIVAKQNVGGSTRSYMVLRDSALANPRGYIEGQAPTDIVYQNVFNSQIPVSTAFGAGNNLNLAQDLEGQEIYSFAFGDTLSTNNANQFVIGYNNTPDATKAFIVANSGNIFTIDYEGNVEAGDLNVGAISATSITVSGEDLNQVIDDKVEYLSTSVDDKLSATEDWVSDTFETKESATQTFNELEGDIGQISAFVSGLPTDIAAKADQTDLDEANGKIDTISGQVEYLSGAIDQNTSDIGDLNTAVGSKANQTDLEALSGTVEGLAETKADLSALQEVDGKFANYTPTETIAETYATKTSLEDYAKLSAIPTGNAQLENTANYITSAEIPTSYVQQEQLEDYATVASLDSYAQKSDIPVLSSSISAFLAQGDNITLSVNENTGVVTINGQAGGGSGKTYSAGTGLALEGEGLSTFVLTAGVADLDGYNTLALKSELNDLATKDALDELSSATSGLPSRVQTLETAAGTYALADNVYSKEIADQTFATKGEIPTVSGLSANMYEAISGDVEAQITGKNYITSEALNGLATEQYVTEQVSGKADQSTVETLSTNLSAAITGVVDSLSTKADTSALDDLASDEDLQYVSGVVSAQAEDITALKAVSGEVDYETVFDMLSSGDTDTLTITKDTTNQKIVLTAAGSSGGDKTYHGDGGIAVDNVNDTISISANFLSANALEGYATQSWVGEQGFALTSQLPTDYTTSAQVSSIVEGYNYITAEGIPNTYALKTDIPTDDEITGLAKDYVDTLNIGTTYATKDELSAKTTSAQVSSIVEGYNYITGVTLSFNDDELNGSSFTFDDKFAVAGGDITINVDNIITNYDIITNDNLTDFNVAKTTDIPTNSDISGIAEDVVESLSTTIRSGLATTSEIPTTVAELTDSGDYALKTDLNDYIEKSVSGEFATSGELASLTQTVNGKADSSDIPTVSTYVAGEGISITSTGTNEYTISATGGGGGGTTYSAGDFISLENDTIAVTGLPEQVEYVSGWVSGMPSGGYTAGEGIDIQNGVISSTVTGVTKVSELINDVGFITSAGLTYSAGTGLELDTTTNTFSLSSAGAGENKVLSSANGSIVWADNVAGGSSINLIAGNRIRLTETAQGIIIDVLDYTISADNQSYSWDMRQANQSGQLVYSYDGGYNINVSFNPSLPNGINYDSTTHVFSGVNGIANGTSIISATLVAEDAEAKTITTTFNIIGVVTDAEFTGSNQTMGLDFAQQSSYISSFYYTYTNGTAPDSISASISNVPAGISYTSSYTNGQVVFTFTGSKDTIAQNFTSSATIKLIANDTYETTFTVTFDVQGIVINEPLYFEAVSNTANVTVKKNGNSGTYPLNFKYSLDNGVTWDDLSWNITPSINKGQRMLVKRQVDTMSGTYDGCWTFAMTGQVKVGGNIMSLINYADSLTGKNNFYALFSGCSQLVDASDLKLPSQTLTNNAYYKLFYNCSNLSAAPATLPATTLANSCYFDMFYSCSSLVTPPQVLATTLANNCCQEMFYGCSSLTSAPELFATNLVGYCYFNMFHGCSSLSSVKVHFTDWNWGDSSTGRSTAMWLDGTYSTGTFTCPTSLPQKRGSGGESGYQNNVNYIPTNWTRVDL